MGIYLPNMEMPKNCEACELAKHFDGYQENDCPFNAFSYYDCPLIPVPEPHGRLISADEVIEFIKNRYEITWKDDYEGGIKDACVDILEKISTMPTVIPASGG